MEKLIKDINKKFLALILFSWLFFIGAIFLAINNYVYLPIEQDTINLFSTGYISSGQKYFHWLFIVGFFGPLFTYLWSLQESKSKKKLSVFQIKKVKEYVCKKKALSLIKFEGVTIHFIVLVVLLPLITWGLAFVFDKVLNIDYHIIQYEYVYFIPLFLFTFITFSTTEFGFRKYFLDKLLKKKPFLQSSLMVSAMTLVWSLPYIGYFHFIYGYPSIIFSLIFFSLFYLSLSVILSFIYYDTKNILFTWIANAWFYSMYLFSLAAFSITYTALIMYAITFVLVAIFFIKYDYKKS